MSWKKNFPPKDGWIQAKLTLRAPVTIEEAQQIIREFFRSPEIGSFDLTGKRMTVIYREKKTGGNA